MVTRLKEVDAVMVGMGWTGSILARELTKAGLRVVGLERGPDRVPGQDFVLPTIRDELRYARRSELVADNAIETVTFRHFPGERALPIRRWGALSPGEGVAGAGIHWTGHHWRFLPRRLRAQEPYALPQDCRSHEADAYPAAAAPEALPCRARAIDPQYRRHHHGYRSQDHGGEPLSAGLGCAQSVRDGRLGVPAECRLQPDRHGGRACVLVGERDHDTV